MTREAGEQTAGAGGQESSTNCWQAADKRGLPADRIWASRSAAIMPSKIRDLNTRNVAAIDSRQRSEVEGRSGDLSARTGTTWASATPVNGDAIYNGAIDNATGCAILLELARAWAALPQKPKRSALFLAVTAEEGGLRGSEYYAAHPLIPAAQTAIDLNYDALFPLGPRQGRGDHGRGADHASARWRSRSPRD